MKRKKHKLCAVSFALAAALCTGSVIHAADEETHETGFCSISEYLPNGMKKSPKRIQSRSTASLPAKFDPRNSASWLSSVKDQDVTGCCWAFSTLDCAAMSSVKNHEEAADFSLSVWQLVYFNYNRISDPLGLTRGDINGTTDSDIVTCGGNPLLASMTLAQGISPAKDAAAPFSSLLKAWNLGKGNVALPENKAYQGYRLSESATLLSTDIQGIKENILKYGAGSLSYCSDAHYSSDYWNPKTCALYIGDTGHPANHAVTVVGWDDTFSKGNFGNHKPEKDGAWLIKNSWGTNWGDSGYFWLSYYDKSLTSNNETVEFFRISAMDSKEHLYQYDGTANFSYMDGGNIEKQANVFQAQGCEAVKEVSFFTIDPDVSYTISIYTNKSLDSHDPTGGKEPVFTASGRVPEQGYHSIPLDNPVSLEKGDYFTVVLQTEGQNSNPSIPIDASADYGWYFSKSNAEAGQSFYMSNGSWYDLNSQGDSQNMWNLRIKALTADQGTESNQIPSPDNYLPDQEVHLTEENLSPSNATPTDKISSIQLSLDSKKVAPDKSIRMDISILPKNASNKTLTYTSSNPKYAWIDQNGILQTTAAGAGKTVKITAHSTDGSNIKSVLTVKIQKKALKKITFKKKITSLKAKQKAVVKAVAVPAKGTNNTLRYVSGNPKYAEVNKNGRITAKAAGKGKKVRITAYSTDGSGKKASIVIRIK